MGRLHINTTIIRLAVTLLVIKGAWLLLGVPQFVNAFVNLWTIGLVPGTDFSLTSNGTYMVIGLVSILTVGVVFRGNLSRRLSIRTSSIANKVILEQSSPKKSLDQLRRLGTINLQIARYEALSAGMGKRLGAWALKYVSKFWRWFEPYAQQFDGFLERKTHEYLLTADILSFLGDMMATVRKWLLRVKEAISYSLPHRESPK
jgi:uncharacterized membrane protein YuzA (DUF378 family)